MITNNAASAPNPTNHQDSPITYIKTGTSAAATIEPRETNLVKYTMMPQIAKQLTATIGDNAMSTP